MTEDSHRTAGASYAAAGVDIAAGDRAVELFAPLAKKASRPEVMGGLGGFAGLFSLKGDYKEPLLAASTDGVGTKLAVAQAMDKHDTVGLDLVAMPYRSRLAEVKRRGLGIWDVYASCRREGSLDSAIEDSVPNDLAGLKHRAPRLEAVAHNGGESARAMAITRALGVEVIRLPSTSPANASWSFDRKLAAWREAFVAHGLL